VIKLTVPKASENRYISTTHGLFGPFDQNGQLEGFLIPFEASLKTLEGKPGIYHENHVVHSKLEGDLYYHPFVGGIIPEPQFSNPKAIRYPVFNYRGQPIRGWNSCGLAVHQGSSIQFTTSGSRITGSTQIAWERIDESTWKLVLVSCSANSPTTVLLVRESVYHLDRLRPSLSDSYFMVEEYRTWNNGLSFPTGINWLVPQLYGTIAAQRKDRPGGYSSREQRVDVYTADFDRVFSPSSVREKIDSLTARLFPETFPIPDKSYGDLAMEASEQVNANKVNMLEFLKDLRRPQDLIPKLKGLLTLKGVSGNYLGFKFGVLPTISDVKEIVAAFKKIKPYIDQNGFKTYGAGWHRELEKDGLLFSKLQRIKLAISDEDDEFQALIARLDSMGTLPTFENVWDLVPYSFVVDWLIDVGGFLERVDSRLRLSRLNIRYVTMSRKTRVTGTINPEIENVPFIGTVDWVHYHRWVSDQCPVPPLSLSNTSKDFSHWLEAGALIIQRASK